jgi:hypothetical protein
MLQFYAELDIVAERPTGQLSHGRLARALHSSGWTKELLAC